MVWLEKESSNTAPSRLKKPFTVHSNPVLWAIKLKIETAIKNNPYARRPQGPKKALRGALFLHAKKLKII